MKHQYVDCQICGSDKNDPFLTVPNRFKIEETFNLVKCGRCGFVFLNPRPEPEFMALYYDEDNYQPHQLADESLVDKIYKFIRDWNIRYKRYLIERYFFNASLLDFGCGSGEFILAMKNAGWQVSGVESALKPRKITKNLRLDVRDNIEGFDTKFDVITLWHVLEHIYDLHHLIENLKSRLKSDGIIVVAVPNLKCIDAQKFGSNWAAYDAPRHLCHFSPKEIQKIFKIFDLQIISYRTLFIDTWYNSLLSSQLESDLNGKKNLLSGMVKFGTIAFLSTFMETIVPFYSSSLIYVIKKRSA